ncbi:MAG: tetratricopeptide repeat protein [Flavitalea sp.]
MSRINHIGVFALIMATGIFSTALAQTENTLIHKGNKKYKLGQFDKALPFYEKALAANGSDPVARYNAGDAFFRNKQWVEAETAFDHAGASGNEATLREKALYNKGVALTKQNKMEESITAYKQALTLNPADEDARVNLQKALLELKKKNPPPQEKEKKEDKKNDKQKNEKPPPSQSRLTKKQVEQLLKALQQREQQAQQKMQQSRLRSGTKPDKDW